MLRERVQDTPRPDHFQEAANATFKENKRRKVCSGTEIPENFGMKRLQTLNEITMSTSFSGIDSPATAFLSLGAGLCAELKLSPEHVPRPRNAFAVEWAGAAQQELLHHPHAAEHVFSDIAEFWQPALRTRMDAIFAGGQQDQILLPLIKNGTAVMTCAWCVRHQKLCKAHWATLVFFFGIGDFEGYWSRVARWGCAVVAIVLVDKQASVSCVSCVCL